MRLKLLGFSLASLVIGGLGAGLSAPVAAQSQTADPGVTLEESREPEAGIQAPSCMADNFNRIFKLNRIPAQSPFQLVVGLLWAKPINGPVFGTNRTNPNPGQPNIKLLFFDPVVGPPSWKCEGVGDFPSFSGQCQSGLLIAPWFTRGIACPF